MSDDMKIDLQDRKIVGLSIDDQNWTPTVKVRHVDVAMAKVQAGVVLVGKSGTNSFHNYKYTALEDIVKAVHPLLVQNNLSFITGVDQVETLADRVNKKQVTEYAVRIRGWAAVVSGVDGTEIRIPCFGEAQSGDDKAIYKAITGMRKYAAQCLFGLSSSDDPEAFDVGGGRASEQRPIVGRPVPEGEVREATMPPENQKPMTERQKLVEVIGEWSGCDPEQIVGVMQTFAKIMKIEGRKMTDAEVTDALRQVATAKFNGATWATFIAPPKGRPTPQQPEPTVEQTEEQEMEAW